jgi:hypothetical protein
MEIIRLGHYLHIAKKRNNPMHSTKWMTNLPRLMQVNLKKDIHLGYPLLIIHLEIKINNLPIDLIRIRIKKMIMIGIMRFKKQKCLLKIKLIILFQISQTWIFSYRAYPMRLKVKNHKYKKN